MPKFLNHDGIAAGIFNRDFSSASGIHVAWDRDLLNSPQILAIMMQRMNRDFENLAVKMRKPWSQSTLELQQNLIITQTEFGKSTGICDIFC